MYAYSEKKLAKDLTRAARAINTDLEPEYNAERQSLNLYRASEPDAPPYSIFLGNLFLKVRSRSRADRKAIIEDFVEQMLNPPELSRDEMLASLAIRARTHFEVNFRNRLIELQAEPPDFVLEVIGDMLGEIVSDRDEVVQTVTLDHLEELETTKEEAVKIARARLIGATDEYQWTQTADNVWVSTYEDDYDFARVLADPAHARFPFDGKPIIFAPSHSVCLVTGNQDPQTLDAMIDIGTERAAEHRSLSQRLWTVDGDGIIAWITDESHAANPIRTLRDLAERISQYTDQKAYLEQLLDQRDEDSYVAEFTVYENEGQYVSYATYTMNLPSYLPEADRIALVGVVGEKQPDVLGFVVWDDFVEAIGPDTLVAMPGLLPRRYQLTASLTPEQDARLRGKLVAL